ncbi:MAG: hypothetical protein JRF41_13730, partial [Deltaproteobacteria bacterium]|nr:hypothetical protein [Deltaproteobacteria bacterium]
VPSDLLDEYRRRGFIVNADSPEREKVVNQYLKYYPKAISGLCMNMAALCNFRCFHCIHFAAKGLDDRLLKPGRMSFETARSAIDWVANGLLEKKQPRMTINFGGGEPLMNWRVIEKVLEYTRQQIQPKLDVHLSLNTGR